MTALPQITGIAIARDIWTRKYRFCRADGQACEDSAEDSFRRVATALARVEGKPERKKWAEAFFKIMASYRFLPAGRILAGAGTGRRVTLFNCFVMGEIDDSLPGIFDELKHGALTMQQGGGIGQDFSTIRPAGAIVRGGGAVASGPLSFMDMWDAMCRTIMSAGARRGAMMATLACDHPDIEQFITAKQRGDRLRMFNLSVLVSDAFMKAVASGADWPLTFRGKTYKTVKARKLWDSIMRANYDSAEPGVIFIDRVNARNNLNWVETIHATNPCGEQPLPPYGACLLGSVNLAQFISQPFTADAGLDEKALARTVRLAVRMLDNAIEVSHYPLPRQEGEARAKRRLGLGLTGLADALAMCQVRYGGERAAKLAERWMKIISHSAYDASAGLARERGAFDLYDGDRFLAADNVRRLPGKIRRKIARYGIRNGLLTSIAPAGTISLLAGNVSSGIEPVFSTSYERAILNDDGSRTTVQVTDFAVNAWYRLKGHGAPLPDYFVTARQLHPGEHLIMQAAVQRHVDSAISKTINCDASIGFDEFSAIYRQAYELGLKGCTTYRPNKVTGAVLNDIPASNEVQGSLHLEAPKPAENTGVVYLKQPIERQQALPGFTYKLKWPDSGHAIYITINDIVEDGRRRPFEVFINSKNMEHYAWTVALTRMISAVFRRGGDVSFVVEELKAVFDPRGGQWMDGKYVPSLLAAIGGVIERHMLDTGFLKSPVSETEPGNRLARPRRAVGDATYRASRCRACGSEQLSRQEGCDTCLSCGHSRCE